jgi:hypothetical protein
MVKWLRYLKCLFVMVVLSSQCLAALELAEIGKVTSVFQRDKQSIIVVELDTKLPPGIVIVLEKDVKAVLGDLYKSDGNIYTYQAIVSGRGKIEKGTKVFIPGKKETEGAEVYLKLERHVSFEPKKQGKVLAVYGPQVHIDRGSLHEVHDRDIFAIYDSSGVFKGNTEAQAVGDYETITRLSTDEKVRIKPGDTVVHIGTRRYYGSGIFWGTSFPQGSSRPETGRLNNRINVKTSPIDDYHWFSNQQKLEDSVNMGDGSGGLLWEWMFKSGLGVQWFLGGYTYTCNKFYYYRWNTLDNKLLLLTACEEMNVDIYSPIVIKKNFNYPKAISPYLGIGACWYKSHFLRYEYLYRYDISSSGELVNVRKEAALNYINIFPVIGVEFFSSNAMHLVVDAKYIPAWRRLEDQGEDHTWSGWITSIAVTTNW